MATVAKKRVTAKSIIENGIKSGWTIARIVKTVKAKVPGSKVTDQVIRVYASTMFKRKEINAKQKDKYLIRKKVKAVVKKKAAPKKKAVKKAPAKKKAASKKKVAKKKTVKKK